MTVQLRPYQQSAVASVATEYQRGRKSTLFVLATGGGKSYCFCHIAERAATKGNRTCILVHRRELLDQASRSLGSMGVDHAIIAAGKPVNMEAMIHVASVQTLARRLANLPPDFFQFIIVDEAHHTTAGTWNDVIKHFADARSLGVTASPIRTDGRGLGEHYESMVHGPDAAWLTANGFLAPAKYYAPPPAVDANALRTLGGDYRMDEAANAMDKPAVMGDVIEHYRKLMDGGTAIAFCCSIAHAEDTAAAFGAAGIAAASIDGRMDAETRRVLLADLGAGRIKVLTSCSLIGEGIDVPSVGGCIMLRPTMSLGLHLQMIGRCLRPSDGKTHAVVIDHVGNALKHGFHTDPRQWSLDGKKKRANDAVSIKVCKVCYAANPATARECAECGHEFEVKSVDDIATVAGTLTELAPKGMRPGDPVLLSGEHGHYYVASNPEDGQVLLCRNRVGAIQIHRGTMRREQLDASIVASLDSLQPHVGAPKRASSGAQTLEDLRRVAAMKGYKPSWADHVYRSRMAKVR